MIDVFPAVEALYESHPVLHREGRILQEGLMGKPSPPYTKLSGVMTEDLSTFGAIGTGLDIEVWDLTFELTSKTFVPGSARRWIEAMRDAFHDHDVIDPVFTTAGCRVTNQTGPYDEDEQFRATTTVELTIQKDMLRPRTRGG